MAQHHLAVRCFVVALLALALVLLRALCLALVVAKKERGELRLLVAPHLGLHLVLVLVLLFLRYLLAFDGRLRTSRADQLA